MSVESNYYVFNWVTLPFSLETELLKNLVKEIGELWRSTYLVKKYSCGYTNHNRLGRRIDLHFFDMTADN